MRVESLNLPLPLQSRGTLLTGQSLRANETARFGSRFQYRCQMLDDASGRTGGLASCRCHQFEKCLALGSRFMWRSLIFVSVKRTCLKQLKRWGILTRQKEKKGGCRQIKDKEGTA